MQFVLETLCILIDCVLISFVRDWHQRGYLVSKNFENDERRNITSIMFHIIVVSYYV